MSGLYNALHGTNDHANTLLDWLDLTAQECGRYRDAWLNADGTEITIFTRNGGGNRETYQDVIDDLATHPNYLRDFDDDFDVTYAHIVFTVPEQHRATAKALATGTPEPTLVEKTQAAIDAIKTPGTRSHAIAQQLGEALQAPGQDITIVTADSEGIHVEDSQ